MKKLFVLIGIVILTMTFLNVSKIDTKNSTNLKLASLITSAKALSEDPLPCYYQNHYNLGYVFYQDECNWEHDWLYECWVGFDETLCGEGHYIQWMTNCNYYEDDQTTHLFCQL